MTTASSRLDTAAMRADAQLLLAADRPEHHCTTAELEDLAQRYREQISTLIPEVAALAQRLPRDSLNRTCALGGIAEADIRLRLSSGNTHLISAAVAQRLARSVHCLCRHYERMLPA